MDWNIPNLLTLLRIVLIPVFVLVFYAPIEWANIASAAIFGLAALTDWLDGYLARRLRQSTVFGAFLDPVADKLMVAVALVLLVEANPEPGEPEPIPDEPEPEPVVKQPKIKQVAEYTCQKCGAVWYIPTAWCARCGWNGKEYM